MARTRKAFVCQECGYESPKWMGKCPSCGEWNTFVEEVETKGRGGLQIDGVSHSRPESFSRISVAQDERYVTDMDELDRVLGGGAVKGSLILIGGDPGIGKSTLLLQVCDAFSRRYGKVLYVSGEESVSQIKMRADRLGVLSEELYLVSETNVDAIISHVQDLRPLFLIIDSIQTVYSPQLSSAPGSVTQVRETTGLFLRMAKSQGITTFIVGHVTKEGAIAGPRVLEHMVDTVLYFEGDQHHSYRILRGVKNRFGSTNEIGIFEMRERGLVQIQNPSELLISERTHGVPGSVVLCSMEGTRPVLVEVQALVSTTAFGMARRMSTGVDYNRVVMLMAVLEKRVGMQLYNQDAYVNIVGGLRVDEPAADLAVITAVASSFRNIPVDPKLVVMGEVGLTGEVRGIANIEKRIHEASKLGFKQCIVPRDNIKGLTSHHGVDIIGVDNISQALEVILGI
ncbi:MAG: DNA repair protein RadA [Clostridiales bacterium]|jgi:DNA repair protein RadA/Sms|nr:DNA repair protein RadA [Clostridiales bacterium]